jgi:hypothetical protein
MFSDKRTVSMRLWIDTALNYAVPWVDNNSRRIITIAKPIITKTVAGAIGFAAHCHPTGSVSACRANRIDRAADRVARTAESRENPVRVKSNLLNRIKLIWVVQSLAQKYFAFRFFRTVPSLSPSRPKRGAYASSRTLVRDAMDALTTHDERREGGR